MALVREVDVLFWEHDHQSDQTMIGEGKKVLFFFFFACVVVVVGVRGEFLTFLAGEGKLSRASWFCLLFGAELNQKRKSSDKHFGGHRCYVRYISLRYIRYESR